MKTLAAIGLVLCLASPAFAGRYLMVPFSYQTVDGQTFYQFNTFLVPGAEGDAVGSGWGVQTPTPYGVSEQIYFNFTAHNTFKQVQGNGFVPVIKSDGTCNETHTSNASFTSGNNTNACIVTFR